MLSSGFRLCRARRLLRRNELGCIVRDVVQIIVAANIHVERRLLEQDIVQQRNDF